MCNLGEKISLAEAEEMMAEVDKDGDGMIDYEGNFDCSLGLFIQTVSRKKFHRVSRKVLKISPSTSLRPLMGFLKENLGFQNSSTFATKRISKIFAHYKSGLFGYFK